MCVNVIVELSACRAAPNVVAFMLYCFMSKAQLIRAGFLLSVNETTLVVPLYPVSSIP